MSDRIFRQWPTNPANFRLDRGSAIFDPFGRVRVSNADTVFDSKLSFGKLPVFWSEVLGGSATSTHSDIDSCVDMAVSANGDYAIRQTRQRWNYQPGKGQLFLGAGRMSTAPGVISRIGVFHGGFIAPYDPHDGLYFQCENGIMSVNIRKGNNDLGTVSLRSVPQSQWNLDRLDGSGPSGMAVDWSKVQIFQLDFQWLGGVRFGIEVDSVLVYVHEFYHAGLLTSVYMSNSTQPMRYEIRSTGGAGTLSHICSSISSEGGKARTGISAVEDTDGVLTSCPDNTITMMLALRMKLANPDAQVLIEKLFTLNTAANTNYRWVLLWNPVIAGTPNWVPNATSPVEVWKNSGLAITMTGGLPLDAGYTARDSRQSNTVSDPSIGLGIAVDGTADVIALGIESIGGTSICAGGIGIRQLV